MRPYIFKHDRDLVIQPVMTAIRLCNRTEVYEFVRTILHERDKLWPVETPAEGFTVPPEIAAAITTNRPELLMLYMSSPDPEKVELARLIEALLRDRHEVIQACDAAFDIIKSAEGQMNAARWKVHKAAALAAGEVESVDD